jgi:transcriptional regulator with XRE-family HTH domain
MKEPYMESGTIGKRIREVREGKGLTLRELSNRTGLTLNGISRVELGRTTPTADTLWALAQGLGVDPGVLFPKAGAPPRPPKTVAELLDAAGVEDRELENPPAHVSEFFEGLSYEETMALARRIINARQAVVAFVARYEQDPGTTPEEVEALKRLATHTFRVNAVAIVAADAAAAAEKAVAEAEDDPARAEEIAEEFSEIVLQGSP